MKCRECLGDVVEGASRCHHCGEVVAGEECPDCLSQVKTQARVCRWCGHRFKRATQKLAVAHREIKAQILPSFFFRFRLLPQEVEITEEKLIIRAPGMFHLWVDEDEIPWNKIAGFNYRNGIIWDRVTIETRGQQSSTITGLAKQDGVELRDILQNLEK